MRMTCARCREPITRGTAITERDRDEVLHPDCYRQLRYAVRRDVLIRG
jgi:hypothetical protein